MWMAATGSSMCSSTSSRFRGRFTCPRTLLKCSASVRIKLIFASSAGFKVMPPPRYQLELEVPPA